MISGIYFQIDLNCCILDIYIIKSIIFDRNYNLFCQQSCMFWKREPFVLPHNKKYVSDNINGELVVYSVKMY